MLVITVQYEFSHVASDGDLWNEGFLNGDAKIGSQLVLITFEIGLFSFEDATAVTFLPPCCTHIVCIGCRPKLSQNQEWRLGGQYSWPL